MFTYSKQLPVVARPDVLVCGAGLAGIGVEACTELSARDGKLEATGDFALTLPLPRWWPVPDRAMNRGESMIRGIVDKDTRLTVERLISSVS